MSSEKIDGPGPTPGDYVYAVRLESGNVYTRTRKADPDGGFPVTVALNPDFLERVEIPEQEKQA